jgi:hypothetical protein
MRTIRVFVSSPGDVQKERRLADNLIRSVAAEFGIRVSVTYSNLLRGDEIASESLESDNAPFRGTACEVMHQHQCAPIPLEQLGDAPQPVVVLLEVLLEKDPARRFQHPLDLLKAIATIKGAVDAGRRITRQSLKKTPSTASRVRTRRRLANPGPEKISVARLPITGIDIFGREEDLAFLDRAWANEDVQGSGTPFLSRYLRL